MLLTTLLVFFIFICLGLFLLSNLFINNYKVNKSDNIIQGNVVNVYRDFGYDGDQWFLTVDYFVENIKYTLQKPVSFDFMKEHPTGTFVDVKYLDTNPKIAKILK